jgi:hypothetical protein
MSSDLTKILERIEDKLDKIQDKQSEHSVVLERHSQLHSKNSDDLATHIKRTDLLEDRMEIHAKEHDSKLEIALQPIKAFKFLAKFAAGAASIYGLIKLVKP